MLRMLSMLPFAHAQTVSRCLEMPNAPALPACYAYLQGLCWTCCFWVVGSNDSFQCHWYVATVVGVLTYIIHYQDAQKLREYRPSLAPYDSFRGIIAFFSRRNWAKNSSHIGCWGKKHIATSEKIHQKRWWTSVISVQEKYAIYEQARLGVA